MLKIIHWATMFDMQEAFSFSPSLPLFFSPIAHSVRKSVSVSLAFFCIKNSTWPRNPLWRNTECLLVKNTALHTIWDLSKLVLFWLSSCKGFISSSFHRVWSFFFLFFWGEGGNEQGPYPKQIWKSCLAHWYTCHKEKVNIVLTNLGILAHVISHFNPCFI